MFKLLLCLLIGGSAVVLLAIAGFVWLLSLGPKSRFPTTTTEVGK